MHNVKPGYRVYPRGFVGGLPTPRAEKLAQPSVTTVTMHTFQINTFKPGDPTNYSNPDVEALYASLIKQSGDVNSFGFRAKVLAVALQAFGTQDFQFWIKEQFTTPAAGEMHRRFIHDMLRYVQGERRELSLDTWAALLDVDSDGIANSAHDPFVDKFFQWCPEATQLPELLQMWCKREGGINDLLVTLHLLFGDF